METISIMYIEDDPADVDLVIRALKKADMVFTKIVVSTKDEFINCLDDHIPDVILSDHSLPAFNSLEALKIVRNRGLKIPFILVTGNTSEEFAVSVMQAGADDYILKDRIQRLPLAIAKAIDKFELENERQNLQKDKSDNDNAKLEEINKIARRLQLAVSSAGMGVWEWNITDNQLTWDEGMYRLYGIKAGDFGYIYDAWLKCLHPEDKPRVDESMQLAITGQREYNTEFRIIRGDGSLRYIRATGIVEKNQNGDMVNMVGVNWDITWRKKDEDKIKESEREIRALAESMPQIVWAANGAGEYIYLNYQWAEYTGLTLEESCGNGWLKPLHPDDRQQVKEAWDSAVNNHTEYNLECRMRQHNGDYHWWLIRGVPKYNDYGKVLKWYGTCTDIEKIKQAEQKLIEKELQQIILIENSPAALAMFDKDMRYIITSKRWLIDYKLEGQQIIGKSHYEVFKVIPPHWKAIHQRCLAGATEKNDEEVFVAIDGSVGWLRWEIHPWYKTLNEIGGIIMMTEVITERKLSENKITLTSNALQQALTELNKIMKSSLDIICTIDAVGKFNNISDASKTIWGYDPFEIKGKAYLDLVFPEDIEKTIDAVNSIMNGMAITSFENRYMCKDGSIVPMIWSASWDDKDRLMYCIARDATEQVSARKKIEESEKRYSELIRDLPVAIYSCDKAGHILIYNNAAIALWGREPEIGKDMWCGSFKIYSLNGIPILHDACSVAKVLEGSKPLIDEGIIIERPNGEKRIVVPHSVPIFDSSGVLTGAINMLTDISDKKQSEQQLIINERRYRALVENGADGVAIINQDGKISYTSPTIKRILGYGEGEVEGLDLFSLLHPEDMPAVTKVWSQVTANPGIPFSGHTSRIIHKDGSWRWIEATVTNMLHDPALNGIVDNFRDITGKKELENLLNKANALARMGSWNLDLLKNTLFWSDITKEIHEVEDGFVPDLQTSIHFYKAGESRDLITKKVQDAVTAGIPFDVELQIVTQKGNEKWIRAIGETEFANGNAISITGSFQDITERKLSGILLEELNLNLQRQTKMLATSNAELEQFAFVASHDLQEPLRMITSFLTLLQDQYQSSIGDAGKKYIYFAVDGANRMRQIILDLLEFSRIGRVGYNKEIVDINKLVDQIQALFQKQIEEKGATIIVDRLPIIHAVRSTIYQVFQNLVSNALKYSSSEISPQINISVSESKDFWQFALSDNGIGIDKKYFETIFIIFQRLHTREEYSGTGIGLAITRKIIENLGGRIWVESEEGKGSTFYFTLPKEQ